jgi:opacity protein-like surface antigen
MYELTVAYAVQGPKTKRFSTFAQLGGGGLYFLPTQDPSPYAEQVRATMVFGVGMNYKLSEHFALRAEYRGLFYKNPDFKNPDAPIPISKLFTVTNEPTLSVVYTFGRGKKKSFVQMY